MSEYRKKTRFNPALKFLCNHRTLEYFEGKNIYPINIEFSISGTCPANCRKCFYRVDDFRLKGLENKYFDVKRFETLLKEFVECGIKSITWTGGGEPTMHPDFGKIVKLTKEAGIEQGLFTNALLEINYDPNLMEWIRVSKTNHDFPVENIKKLRSCKTLGLCINYSGKDDAEAVRDGIAIAEELDRNKADPKHSTYLQLRPAMNILGKLHECNLPKIEHPLVILTEKHAAPNEERGYTECEAYHFTPFIWQDGKVDVCAYHKGEKEFNLGDVYVDNFKDIMNAAPKYVRVVPNCQVCCKLHEMNKLIEQRKNLEDINFI